MHRLSDGQIDDAKIAATAVVHDLIIVTRCVRDFRHFAVWMLDRFFIPR